MLPNPCHSRVFCLTWVSIVTVMLVLLNRGNVSHKAPLPPPPEETIPNLNGMKTKKKMTKNTLESARYLGIQLKMTSLITAIIVKKRNATLTAIIKKGHIWKLHMDYKIKIRRLFVDQCLSPHSYHNRSSIQVYLQCSFMNWVTLASEDFKKSSTNQIVLQKITGFPLKSIIYFHYNITS